MWKTYGVIVLFALSYWGARIYSMTPYWDGTDGNGLLANIFLQNIHGPLYLENAWVDGRMHCGYPTHPAILYELPRLSGILLVPLFGLKSTDPITLAIALKLISACVQFVLFSLFFWMGLTRKYRHPSTRYYFCLTTILISISPLALLGSNEFQTDTLTGILLIGGASLFLVISSEWSANRKDASWYLPLMISGTLMGLGKNEWSIAFLLAIAAASAFGILLRRKDIYLKSSVLAAGLVVGNLLSLAIDSINYLGGWSLITGMVTAHSAIGSPRTYYFTDTLLEILPHTITIYGLLLFGCFLITSRREFKAETLVLFFSATAILSGYTLSSWGLHPRYFYPSLLLLLGLFFLLSDDIHANRINQKAQYVLFFSILITNIYFGSTIFSHTRQIWSWGRAHGPIVLQPLHANEAYLVDACFLLPNLNRNFIHAWVGDQTIIYHLQWAQKDLKLDGIKQYPPYTSFPDPFAGQTTTHHD